MDGKFPDLSQNPLHPRRSDASSRGIVGGGGRVVNKNKAANSAGSLEEVGGRRGGYSRRAKFKTLPLRWKCRNPAAAADRIESLAH